MHRLTARLRLLHRYGADLCLGRMVRADDPDPVYVGRLGLSDQDGRRLLVDWRTPAAEPFFAATHGTPMGLRSRRRYRWADGRVVDYWDEVFDPSGLEGAAALDDQSAFIASLGASRSERMRDVLGTIQADQDAVVRAGADGVLVVDGGPGTGKTVVALHRAAYLLHATPPSGGARRGVLVVGPHPQYLAYTADVLPSLGEDGVRTCTLRDLVPEGTVATAEPDPEVARLKSSAAMVRRAVEAAVALYEEPPTERLVVATDWVDVVVDTEHWAEAFGAVEPGTTHNEARAQVLDALLDLLVDGQAGGVPPELLRRELARDPDLRRALRRAWPDLAAADLVGDLWSVPAYLRRCAPWLSRDEVRLLQRDRPHAWTVADLPLLDAARQRLGDPEAARRRRRAAAGAAAQRAHLADVVDHLVATDDSEMQVMSMLRHEDLRDRLVDDAALPVAAPDELAGPFAHVVVDEAQELTDAEWQMLLSRCPSRSLTVVGDRAQARRGFAEPWQERLRRVGLDRVRVATLTVNYRTPREVMVEAEPVIRAVLPDANVPLSVRSTGLPVRHGRHADLAAVLSAWLEAHEDGVACVIGGPGTTPVRDLGPRVSVLTPELAKGLEFDLVVLLLPAHGREEAGSPGAVERAVDRYVAMTRATQELVVLR